MKQESHDFSRGSVNEVLNVCVTNLDNYDYDDIKYIKLTIYEAIADLIHEQRRGLAATDIPKEEVLSLLQNVYSKTEETIVTQERSSEKRSTILGNEKGFLDDIENAYNQIEE